MLIQTTHRKIELNYTPSGITGNGFEGTFPHISALLWWPQPAVLRGYSQHYVRTSVSVLGLSGGGSCTGGVCSILSSSPIQVEVLSTPQQLESKGRSTGERGFPPYSVKKTILSSREKTRERVITCVSTRGAFDTLHSFPDQQF